MLTEKEFLAQYDPSKYERPSCTVDTILMSVIDKKLKILLIKRGQHPWLGRWALPGGFVNMTEDLDHAVWRELEEETNVSSVNYFKQLYTLGKVDRDPRTRVISTVYLALIPEENIRNMHSGDDASDARWFDIRKVTQHMTDNQRVSILTLYNEEVGERIEYEVVDTVMDSYIKKDSRLIDRSTSELAADHIKVINMAIDEVQNRVVTSGLIFSLLPTEFTLRQVREIYEIVTNKKISAPNFNKSIKKMLVSTEHTVYSYNKWARLYRFNPMWQFLKEDL